MILIGIDPGSKSGAISVMQTSPDDGVRLLAIHLMPQTEKNIYDLFYEIRQQPIRNAIKELRVNEALFEKEFESVKCILESQHAFPGMGAGAQWTFAQHYGFLRGVLVALQIPFIEVAPQTWMGYFGFRRLKDEDKKKHKLRILQKAQNLYPHSSVALQTADSLMLCEFLRLLELKN